MKIKSYILGSMLAVFIAASVTQAARLYLSPNGGDIISDCPNSIDVMIDTEGEDIYGAAVNLVYDKDNVQIVSFYPNEVFNLPLKPKYGENNFSTALLSVVRDENGEAVKYNWDIKYATLIIKNKEPIDSTTLDFVFNEEWDTMDESDVWRYEDAQDVLVQPEAVTFNFVQGECSEVKVEWEDHLSADFDFESNLEGNLDAIQNLTDQFKDEYIESVTVKGKVDLMYVYAGAAILLVIIIIAILIRRKKK